MLNGAIEMKGSSQDNLHSIWAEISYPALRKNFQSVRAHISPSTRVMAVVKGNAYGHGAVGVGSFLEKEGADLFGVARLGEAEALRNGKTSRPVLIFGITDPALAPALAAGGFIQTVNSPAYAKELNKAARAAGCRVKVHLKVDTGMGRLGVLPNQAGATSPVSEMIELLTSLDSLQLDGIYTHFARCDEKMLDSARAQLDIYNSCIAEPAVKAIRKQLSIHAANSAATMVLPAAHFDIVRPGIILYGLRPSAEMDSSGFDLEPVMSIKTRVSNIKRVPKGFPLGYGHTYITDKETVIATVPVGYADGYPRLLSSTGQMLVRGVPAGIAGRVCMDQLMLDVGHIPGVEVGDEVVVLGRQGENEITADDLARLTETINYEVVARILPRIPRIYID